MKTVYILRCGSPSDYGQYLLKQGLTGAYYTNYQSLISDFIKSYLQHLSRLIITLPKDQLSVAEAWAYIPLLNCAGFDNITVVTFCTDSNCGKAEFFSNKPALNVKEIQVNLRTGTSQNPIGLIKESVAIKDSLNSLWNQLKIAEQALRKERYVLLMPAAAKKFEQALEYLENICKSYEDSNNV